MGENDAVIVCSSNSPSSVCGGPPLCKCPHSQEELGEWWIRWKHRDQRKLQEGSLRLAKVPLQGDGRNGVPLSASKVSGRGRREGVGGRMGGE